MTRRSAILTALGAFWRPKRANRTITLNRWSDIHRLPDCGDSTILLQVVANGLGIPMGELRRDLKGMRYVQFNENAPKYLNLLI